jgi:hypothetical protein
MKIAKNGSSMRQTAYARRVWAGQGTNKKQVALDVGYGPNVANSIVSKIESKRGFNNAIAKLATESNCLALAVMAEFKARNMSEFTNKDLISSLNAITQAWDRFNKGLIESQKPEDNGKNKLKTIMIQRINNQVINTAEQTEPVDAEFTETSPEDLSTMDF